MYIVSMALKEFLPSIGLLPAAPFSWYSLPTWLIATMMVMVVPIIEEWFRFWVVDRLRGWIGFWSAALIANSLWVAAHLPNSAYMVIVLFVAGAILSVLLWRTWSVWACVIAHATYNMVPAAFMMMFSR